MPAAGSHVSVASTDSPSGPSGQNVIVTSVAGPGRASVESPPPPAEPSSSPESEPQPTASSAIASREHDEGDPVASSPH